MTATINTRTAELVDFVKAYAAEHYGEGWDVVVEAFSDAEIAERVGKARTEKGALAKFATQVSDWSEREAEADSYREVAPVEEEARATAEPKTPRKNPIEHIVQAFAGKPKGTFLTVSQIAAFVSTEYVEGQPSYNVIDNALHGKGKAVLPKTIVAGRNEEAKKFGATKV